jgi:hypothetical protein
VEVGRERARQNTKARRTVLETERVRVKLLIDERRAVMAHIQDQNESTRNRRREVEITVETLGAKLERKRKELEHLKKELKENPEELKVGGGA